MDSLATPTPKSLGASNQAMKPTAHFVRVLDFVMIKSISPLLAFSPGGGLSFSR